jgi:hypothetical protein
MSIIDNIIKKFGISFGGKKQDKFDDLLNTSFNTPLISDDYLKKQYDSNSFLYGYSDNQFPVLSEKYLIDKMKSDPDKEFYIPIVCMTESATSQYKYINKPYPAAVIVFHEKTHKPCIVINKKLEEHPNFIFLYCLLENQVGHCLNGDATSKKSDKMSKATDVEEMKIILNTYNYTDEEEIAADEYAYKIYGKAALIDTLKYLIDEIKPHDEQKIIEQLVKRLDAAKSYLD